ncbi:MAG: nucleotidyltransferase domain-containing protein [Euryarchaeota archaeon]|nr:nucleotidyltransferase domain-containing protein [Euryarchaeota archaeon]
MGLREAWSRIRTFEASARSCGTGACVRVPRSWRGDVLVVRAGPRVVKRGLAAPCGNSGHITVPKAMVHRRVVVSRTGLMEQIAGFAGRVKAQVPGSRLWFYGSHLRGRPRRDSDIDLLVVTPRPLSPERRQRLVERLWPMKRPPDILWYTRRDFEREKGMCAIVDEVRKTGVRV